MGKGRATVFKQGMEVVRGEDEVTMDLPCNAKRARSTQPNPTTGEYRSRRRIISLKRFPGRLPSSWEERCLTNHQIKELLTMTSDAAAARKRLASWSGRYVDKNTVWTYREAVDLCEDMIHQATADRRLRLQQRPDRLRSRVKAYGRMILGNQRALEQAEGY